MDLMNEFESVSKEFAEFRQTLEDAKSQPMEDHVRQYLEDVTKALDEQFAEVKKTFPEAVKEIKRVQTEATATNKAATDKLAAVHQRMAEMEKEEAAAAAAAAVALAAGPKPKPPVVVDPLVGGQLRGGELLSLYGLKSAVAATPANAGSIWRILDDVKEKPAEPPPPPPPPEPPQAEEPPPAPPAKKKKETGSFKGMDIFDNLSQIDDE